MEVSAVARLVAAMHSVSVTVQDEGKVKEHSARVVHSWGASVKVAELEAEITHPAPALPCIWDPSNVPRKALYKMGESSSSSEVMQ